MCKVKAYIKFLLFCTWMLDYYNTISWKATFHWNVSPPLLETGRTLHINTKLPSGLFGPLIHWPILLPTLHILSLQLSLFLFRIISALLPFCIYIRIWFLKKAYCQLWLFCLIYRSIWQVTSSQYWIFKSINTMVLYSFRQTDFFH